MGKDRDDKGRKDPDERPLRESDDTRRDYSRPQPDTITDTHEPPPPRDKEKK